MTTIDVVQQCFLTLQDFNGKPIYRKGKNNPGVYIWGFSLEQDDYAIPTTTDNFFPYYVGKSEPSGCIYKRVQEHTTELFGGNFSIFNVQAAKTAGTKIGDVHNSYKKISSTEGIVGGPILPDPTFPELLHFPEGLHRMHTFLNDSEIQNQLDWMMKHFCVIFLRLENDPTKAQCRDLEKYIGNLIGYNRLINKPYAKPEIEVRISDYKNLKIENYADLFQSCQGRMKGSKFGI